MTMIYNNFTASKIYTTVLYLIYFSGTVYLIPVIGGYVADSLAGKYNTILGSGLIYVLGIIIIMTISIIVKPFNYLR